MKKTIFILLAGLLVFSLAACGNAAPDSTADTIENNVAETEETESDHETEGTETANVEFDLEAGTVMLNNGVEMPILGIGTFSLSNEQASDSVYWARAMATA